MNVRLIAVQLMIVCLIFSALSGYAGDFRARVLPVKPAKATIPPGYDPGHIQIKFIDELEIGLSGDGRSLGLPAGFLKNDAAVEFFEEVAVHGGRWMRQTTGLEDKMDEMRSIAQANLGREIADLNNFFVLAVPDGISAESWMDKLNSFNEIELAWPLPLPMNLPVPDYESAQGYLNAATDGINARYAWTLGGGTGSMVTICDLEYSWNLNHDDLPSGITTWVPSGYTPVDPFSDDNHGTAVLGELVSLNNSWGTTGAAYGASMVVAPTYLRPPVGDSAWYLSFAMANAISNLVAGDILLIEQQMAGPYWTVTSGDTGLVPVEWDLTVYNTVLTAVGNGIHVVEAAGNGYQNLDNAAYNSGHAPFLPQNHSGAIIVGAGGAPAAFGGTFADRSRISFSNYGLRVDLQGWGEAVTTTGYGYLYNSEGVDREYTGTFSGTSAASPIVAAAVALVSSVNEYYNGSINQISPAGMLNMLKVTGSQQQGGLHPPWEIIGPRPDVMAAINNAGLTDTLYFKPGYTDYSPIGMPDFSQKQDAGWRGYDRWTYDGPVALANCLWWFDSKFETAPVDPRPFYPGNSGTNDNYNLVQSYGAWDDHDTNNVHPLIEELASIMTTNDTMTLPGLYEYGTNYYEVEAGINTWLTNKGLRSNYTDTTVDNPDFSYLSQQLQESQNIILLIGFYAATQGNPQQCCRLGGHYVNMVGVNDAKMKIAVSDPFLDIAASPVPSHNDAVNVSHEVYQTAYMNNTMCTMMDNHLWLTDYPMAEGMTALQWERLNGGFMCYPDYPRNFYALVEYAFVICPVSTGCWCMVGDGNQNGAINILDVTYIINYLYKGGPAPFHNCLADANCNCAVNILDVTYLINYLYKGGNPPCSCTQWIGICGPLK